MKAVDLINRLRRRQNATEEDVYYCYRLLLEREPDADGLKVWTDLIRQHKVTTAFLVDSFMESEEFRAVLAERRNPQPVELPGYTLYVRLCDYFIGAAIARDKSYEPHLTAALRGCLEPGMTFLDIGANVGYFTCLAASCVEPSGRVLAFEPMADNRKMLALSIEANGFANVTIYPFAAADRPGRFALERTPTDSNGRLQAAGDSAEEDLVEAVALDDVLTGLSRLDVVKMDIEGAEPMALRGMTGLLGAFQPLLFFEFSPRLIEMTSGTQPLDLLDSLTKLNYSLHILESKKGDAGPVRRPDEIMRLLAGQPERTHVDLLARPKPSC